MRPAMTSSRSLSRHTSSSGVVDPSGVVVTTIMLADTSVQAPGLRGCCLATIAEVSSAERAGSPTIEVPDGGLVFDCYYGPIRNREIILGRDGIWRWNPGLNLGARRRP